MPPKQQLLFTPGPLLTTRTVKEAMLFDYGSRDKAFMNAVANIRTSLLRIAGLSSSSTNSSTTQQQKEKQQKEPWACILLQGTKVPWALKPLDDHPPRPTQQAKFSSFEHSYHFCFWFSTPTQRLRYFFYYTAESAGDKNHAKRLDGVRLIRFRSEEGVPLDLAALKNVSEERGCDHDGRLRAP